MKTNMVTQSKSKTQITRSVHGKFNCITVKYNGTRHSIYVFFLYQKGSFVDHQAYKPYTLVGPPALRLVLDPLAVIFLDNRLYICLFIYCPL